jgi:hypothetical protein
MGLALTKNEQVSWPLEGTAGTGCGAPVSVRRVAWRRHLKEIFFDDGSSIRVPRSACVSYGDSVIRNQDGAYVVCKNGSARILPTYVALEKVLAGSLELDLVVKEITEPEEFEAYEALTRFHYRGHSLFGRTARLVVRNFHPIYPKVIGYIELTTPFYMNKARAALLDAPFKANGVAWDRWNAEVQRQYIHLHVRIARCVVYPEFRGQLRLSMFEGSRGVPISVANTRS